MTVNILGTDYTVEYRKYEEDPCFVKSDLSGYCAYRQRLIVVGLMRTFPSFAEEPCETILAIEREILRHEIVHAFLYESGLDSSSLETKSWANNEEMVDWFALQGPKIFKVWKEADIL